MLRRYRRLAIMLAIDRIPGILISRAQGHARKIDTRRGCPATS
jgi:hypothetical protein